MSKWQEIRQYVGFDGDDEAALRANYEIVRPRFDAIVEDFYRRIMASEGTRRLITEGEPQLMRLKGSLLQWLESTFRGPWDEPYYQIHSRIGRVHVRIGLEPRWVIAAMTHVRWGLQSAIIAEHRDDPAALGRALRANAKICDIELAIMLDSYGEEYTKQLKRRERLAAIGQLGASISHEVKNPLGVIASSVYALREYCDARHDERAARHLDRIQRNVDQANSIVTTLLDFLRDRSPARAERDWNALVAEAAEGVPLPADVRLELRLGPDGGRAAVDAVQVTRVVSNLVRNAAEAMHEGGPVAVETGGDAESVEICVRDRGPGLPSDVLPQLFEPLFTTKQVGTGLGLALAKAVVEAHQGTIRAANAPGGGAEFRVRLPRAAPPGERDPGAAP